VEVHISNNQNALEISSQDAANIVRETLARLKHPCDEISIHFISKKEISRLHGTYFNDPTPTDCISFPIDNEDETGYCLLGEIFVCPEVAIEYATRLKRDVYRETTLYLVHGILHLIGYDDIDPADRRRMRAAERRVLIHLDRLGLKLKK
jgi:probable rRNA maturation factor